MQFTAEELKEKVQLHRKWRLGEPGGVRLDLRGADLTGADLTGADLTRANLTDAYLTRANLTGADLTRADLTGANLTGADLTRAYLTGADLTRANLTRAYLTGANLTDANLTGADLTRANLPHHSVCPEEGAFIGWKKVRQADGYDDVLLKLQILEDARRINSLRGRKCRAEKVLVLAAEDLDGNPVDATEFRSRHDHSFIYKVGEVAICEKFNDDIRQECTHGLHFFVTKREALAW